MTKIRLNTAHRDILRKYGQEKIATLIDRKKEQALYDSILEATNKAIRAKYPEEHMVILRQYKLTTHDRCIRYQMPSGRVDGFTFYNEERLVDLPQNSGCYSGVVYPVNAKFEAAYDEYGKAKLANDAELKKKKESFEALIASAKTLDDVMEVIALPAEIQEQLGRRSSALVALSTETLKSLKKDFALKQAA